MGEGTPGFIPAASVDPAPDFITDLGALRELLRLAWDWGGGPATPIFFSPHIFPRLNHEIPPGGGGRRRKALFATFAPAPHRPHDALNYSLWQESSPAIPNVLYAESKSRHTG